MLETHLEFKQLDLVALEEKLKKGKGTEEEPFEGEIIVEEFATAI